MSRLDVKLKFLKSFSLVSTYMTALAAWSFEIHKSLKLPCVLVFLDIDAHGPGKVCLVHTGTVHTSSNCKPVLADHPLNSAKSMRLRKLCCAALHAGRTVTASSLAEAVRHAKDVKVLNLAASEDLLCKNIMCEHVGDPCICRLSAALDKLPNVEELDISDNKLTALPEAIGRMPKLLRLNVRGNQLQETCATLQEQFPNAEVLM